MRSSDWSSDVGSSDLTRIGIVREAVALGRKIFEFGLLGTGQIACDADRCDGGTLGHRFIETKRLGPARQARKMLDSADDPADDGNVAIEMARRVDDNGIEFGAAAGIGRHIPTEIGRASCRESVWQSVSV